MTDHPHRRSTDLWPTPSDSRFRKLWIGFVNHLRNTKAPMGLIYAGSAIVLLGWWGVQHQQEQIVNTQRESDLRATASALYSQAIQQWASDNAAYKLCLDSVTRSDLNRQQWEDIAEGLKEIGAEEFAARVLSGPVLSSEPRTEADCTDPGPPPRLPEDVAGALLEQSMSPVEFLAVTLD